MAACVSRGWHVRLGIPCQRQAPRRWSRSSLVQASNLLHFLKFLLAHSGFRVTYLSALNIKGQGAVSSVVEHVLHTHGVAGSNPAPRTISPFCQRMTRPDIRRQPAHCLMHVPARAPKRTRTHKPSSIAMSAHGPLVMSPPAASVRCACRCPLSRSGLRVLTRRRGKSSRISPVYPGNSGGLPATLCLPSPTRRPGRSHLTGRRRRVRCSDGSPLGDAVAWLRASAGRDVRREGRDSLTCSFSSHRPSCRSPGQTQCQPRFRRWQP